MEERLGSVNATETRPDDETVVRRDFLKRVGKATATAPAIALLMAANAKPASAKNPYSSGGSCGSGSS